MRRGPLALALALALAVPMLAEAATPPSGAAFLLLGSQTERVGRVYWWTSATADGAPASNFTPGDDAFFHVDVRLDDIAANASRSYFVNVSGLALAPGNLSLV